jgi:hypothetical protein
VQLTVDNDGGQFVCDSFATVRFESAGAPDSFALPPSALIFRKNVVHIATGSGEGHVQLKRVTVPVTSGGSLNCPEE